MNLSSREIDKDKVIELLKSKNCDLPKFLHNVKILNKNSSSDSIIISASIKLTSTNNILDVNDNLNDNKHIDYDIIIKITFKSKNLLNNGLEFEKSVYENIISKLISNQNTPCLVDYLGSYECLYTEFDNIHPSIFSNKKNIFNVEDKLRSTFKTQLQEIKDNNEDYDYSKINLLITKKSQGTSLEKFIVYKRYSIETLIYIIFQILYTLITFNTVPLKHNDLHFGNIFIEELDEAKTLSFKLSENSIITIKTKYIPLIYDYDIAVSYNRLVDRNISVDLRCMDIGQCGIVDKYLDVHGFFSVFYYIINYYKLNNKIINPIKKWIEKSVDDEFILNNSINTDYPQRSYELLTLTEGVTKSPSKYIDNLLSYFNGLFKITSDFINTSQFNYTIPSAYNIITDYPKSKTNLHKPLKIKQKPYSIKDIDKEYILNQVPYLAKDETIRNILFSWLKELDELKRTDEYIKNVNDLYKFYLVKKKIEDTNYDILKACFILCFPMYHSINSDRQLFLVNQMQEKNVQKYIDDIWNIYSNKLPVKMIELNN